MDGYGYPYGPHPPGAPQYPLEYPDRGDGFGDHYAPHKEDFSKEGRPSCSQYPSGSRHHRDKSRGSESHSRTKSRSHSRSRSRSRSHSKSRSHSRSRSQSGTRTPSISLQNKLSYREPTLLDAFRVMYLSSSSKHKKSTTKYLATKKKQDRISEFLKNDGLGSKRWYFYPRKTTTSEPVEVPGTRDNCDQRVKVDGNFLRKYKKTSKVDTNAPAAKLKRWELILYEKLGFIQAV